MATEHVIDSEIRIPNEEAAWKLFERLQALVAEFGGEIVASGVYSAEVYDAPEDLVPA